MFLYIYIDIQIYVRIYIHIYNMYTHTYIDMYVIAYNVNTALSLSLFLPLYFFSSSFFYLILLSSSVSYLSTCLLSPCSWRRLLIEDRFCFVLKRARTHPNYVLYHVKNGNKVVDQFLFLTPCTIVFSTFVFVHHVSSIDHHISSHIFSPLY